MRRAILAGIGLLSIATMGTYTGGGTANPDRYPISSDPIEDILTGAPVQDEFNITTSRARISMNPLRYRFSHTDTSRTLELQPIDGFIYTYGGTDPSRTTNDGLQLKGHLLTTDVGMANLTMHNVDSTEVVILSNVLGKIDDANDAWYYIKFSMLEPDGATWVMGFWGGMDPHGNTAHNIGSPFENSATAFSDFDGVINDSVNMIAFILKEDHSSPADTVFIHVRKDGTVEETAVGLDDSVDAFDTTGIDQEWAFHVFGRDSLQYSFNGQTGSVDISSVFTVDSDPMRVGLCGQQVTASALGTVYFQTFWGAFGPR